MCVSASTILATSACLVSFAVFCFLTSQQLEWRDFMKTHECGFLSSFLGYMTETCDLWLTRGDLNAS